MKKIITLAFAFMLVVSVNAQTDEEKAAAARAQANNPIASVTAFNLQSYYSTNLSGVVDGTSNTYWLRFATPTGRVLWRYSAPFSTYVNKDLGISESGLGDMDLFAAYLAVSKPKFSFGIGPSVSAPTASADVLGTGKWTGGLAAVAFAIISSQLQMGALAIWRTDFAGSSNRADVDIFAVQPFAMFQAGKGLYFRTAPTWNFNLRNGSYNVPVGFGIGKVIKINDVVCNFFIEPQFSALHNGPNQPLFQLYSALNMQF
ncbi:MAG: hypothetical protein BM564_11485 [Bacteroidetes bacterium MedPE-SWsnd-G2]|nr:MAG: hypothetical protein BM564_11485 [Bacteroidetes bacterium MedPE-SWsnd-G2]